MDEDEINFMIDMFDIIYGNEQDDDIDDFLEVSIDELS